MSDLSEADRLMYQQAANVAAIFWEWRDKLLNRYFVAIGALSVFAAALYNDSQLRGLLPIPFGLGAIVSITLSALDWRTAQILRSSYQQGRDVELRYNGKGGMFKSIEEGHYKGPSYTWTLQSMYVGMALLCLFIAGSIWFGL